MKRTSAYVFPLLVALYYPFCTAKVQPTMPPGEVPLAELWQQPDDLSSRNLRYGPWGSERAPDPDAIYTFVERKQQGTNPGVTVMMRCANRRTRSATSRKHRTTRSTMSVSPSSWLGRVAASKKWRQ